VRSALAKLGHLVYSACRHFRAKQRPKNWFGMSKLTSQTL